MSTRPTNDLAPSAAALEEHRMVDELTAFYAQHQLPERCAMETYVALLPEHAGPDTPLKQSQRAWLSDYCERWDAMLERHRGAEPRVASSAPPPPDQFAGALAACINAMCQDDATGTVVALRRVRGLLVSSNLSRDQILALYDNTGADFEALIFDGGNTAGDAWKHIFLPHERAELFVRDALDDLIPPAPSASCATAG
jgi:hypothetical protein